MQIEKAYLFARQITAGEVPILPPDYWINDAGVDHFHDLITPTSDESRPCTTGVSRYFTINTTIQNVPSDSDCGVTGAKEIPMFLEENILQIPLYRRGELSAYSVRFTYRPSSTSEGYWRPEVIIGIYNGDTVIDSHSWARTIYTDNIKKVFIYAGVDTISYWNYVGGGSMSSISQYLFCGIAVAEDYFGNTNISHIGGGYALSAIEGSDTSYSRLGDAWYTRP